MYSGIGASGELTTVSPLVNALTAPAGAATNGSERCEGRGPETPGGGRLAPEAAGSQRTTGAAPRARAAAGEGDWRAPAPSGPGGGPGATGAPGAPRRRPAGA